MDASRIAIRRAIGADLAIIVALLADDPLGAARETSALPLLDSYARAFAAIDRDENNELVVASIDDAVVGVLQLTFIPYITHRGSWRALIEGVRVGASHRSSGVGQAMFEWAIARATSRRCGLVQLTSDKQRPDAIRFYERLGFVASHEGMKLQLPVEPDGSPAQSFR